MAKTIELSYTVRNGQPSVQIHVTEIVEGSVKDKLLEILSDLPEPIADSLKNLSRARLLSGDEVEVQTVSASSENAHSEMPPTEIGPCSETTIHPPKALPNHGKTNPKKSGGKPITENQLRTINQALSDRHIPVAAFCHSHGVDRIEDLTKGDAWKIINERNY